MIEVRRVTKTFETVKAVDSVSFSAVPGEIFGLLGPNGAGKSTTIRMIMNILLPDSGEILFDGKPLCEKDKDRIGYLPEERGLYKKVKVNDILVYLADLKGRNPRESHKQIDYWLDRFGLMQWKHRKVEELSKGMAQKVQFIASVAHDPDLLFFDEPFSGLDPVSSDLLLESISDLGKRGKTILFSTHIMDHAEKICSRIFLMNKGKEVLYGSIEDVKNRHGKNSVIIEFDGNADFLSDLPFVEHIISYPRWLEVELTDQGDPDDLLKALVGRLRLRRFQIVAPSLHKIFIDLVGKTKEDDNE